MGDPGTALAAVAFADQCIKYGIKLVKRCKNYRHASEEAKELLITIESNWLKTEAQIQFLKTVAHSLDGSYLSMQSRVLSELEGKLKTATLTLDQLIENQARVKDDEDRNIAARVRGLSTMTRGKKVKYAVTKGALQGIVDDLEKWQARFDPSWMLLLRMESRAVGDQMAQEAAKQRSDQSPFIMAANAVREIARQPVQYSGLEDERMWLDTTAFVGPGAKVPFSPFVIFHHRTTGNMLLLDEVHCNPQADFKQTTEDAFRLAQVLKKVDPTTFSLLTCEGVVRSSQNITDQFGQKKLLPKFLFAFKIAPILRNPRSLRQILTESFPYPLDERFNLSRQLLHSVLFIHTASFVHKNIRPETIAVFQNAKSEIGEPYLLGFERFRPADGQTYMAGDGKWEQNLYRHPTRQGFHPEQQYDMRHDIYSAGVVLLEIGLWTSFVAYIAQSTSTSDTSGKQSTVPNDILTLLPQSDERDPRKRAFRNKDMLENLARRALPQRMGRMYTDVVLMCLGCVDEDQESYGGSSMNSVDEGREGVIFGVRYIENILEKARNISF